MVRTTTHATDHGRIFAGRFARAASPLLLGLLLLSLPTSAKSAGVAQDTGDDTAPPPNLLANGNFETGNVGFTSGYLLATAPTTSPGQEGSYTVGTNPQRINGLGASFGDHTTGTGNMLIVNGSTNAEGQAVWGQNVPVRPRTIYRFSFWVASWGRLGDSTKAENPAQLEVRINGQRPTPPSMDGPTPFDAPAVVGQWRLVSVLWRSGSSTTARLTLIDRNHEFIGNDFALDDFSFQDMDHTHDAAPHPSR